MRIGIGPFSFEIGGRKKKKQREAEQRAERRVDNTPSARLEKFTAADMDDMCECVGAFEGISVDVATKQKILEDLADSINKTSTTSYDEISSIVSDAFSKNGAPIKKSVADLWAANYFEE